MAETIETTPFEQLLNDVRRSVRYHDKRRQHFAGVHNFVTLVAFLLGTGTLAAFVEGFYLPVWLKLLPALLATVLLGISLVYRVSEKASLHNDLKRRFIGLEQKMIGASEDDKEKLIPAYADERLAIEAEELPIKRVLDIICHNELMRAQGYPDDHEDMWEIKCWHRCTAQWVNVSPGIVKRIRRLDRLEGNT